MEFLMNYNLTNEDINNIMKKNNASIIKNIVTNKKNVSEVIEYLISLGVTSEAIREAFIYQIGLFFKTKDEIKTAFDEYEIDSIVKSLNYDANTLDLIEFN